MSFRKTGFRPKAKQCIVFDMDETLCVYNEETRLRGCQDFKPKPEMVELAKAAKRHGYDLVIATARPHFCQWGTWRWLEAHGVQVGAVYHRDGGTYPYKASEVKTKMLKDISKTWEVHHFYDDSPFNVKAAQELGMPATLVPGNEDYWLAACDS